MLLIFTAYRCLLVHNDKHKKHDYSFIVIKRVDLSYLPTCTETVEAFRYRKEFNLLFLNE